MQIRQCAILKKIGKITLSVLFLVWLGNIGWASTSENSLLLEGDRLTGNLSQVKLRTVLEQLHKQLGIIYEAPAGELDKLVSVDLKQTPILSALAKILAPWDYAFTMNGAGRLQFLFITPKAPQGETLPGLVDRPNNFSSDPSRGMEEDLPKQRDPVQAEEMSDPSLAHGLKPQPAHSSFSSSQPFSSEEPTGLKTPETGIPMAIQPVPPGTTMPIVPSIGGNGMQVNPATNPPNMPIIPGTSYPPMDIQPVPDYLQEEMIRNIQP